MWYIKLFIRKDYEQFNILKYFKFVRTKQQMTRGAFSIAGFRICATHI